VGSGQQPASLAPWRRNDEVMANVADWLTCPSTCVLGPQQKKPFGQMKEVKKRGIVCVDMFVWVPSSLWQVAGA
jgi:hypothetical protein